MVGREHTGKEAARKYFEADQKRMREPAADSSQGAHYLALHFGGFTQSDAYHWSANNHDTGVGTNNYGVTYRMYEWVNSVDLQFRVDFTNYNVDPDRPFKMSLLPMLVFPDASSKFPLYFGTGLGPGIFFKQVQGKSSLSLDVQLVAGARFMDIYEGAGFFIETGLKNHFLVLSDGQFNGTFVSGGAVFTF